MVERVPRATPRQPAAVLELRQPDVGGDHMFESLQSPATISPFRLDKYEVTVGRFRAFVNAGMGTQTNHPDDGFGAHVKIPGSGWDPSWNMSLAADTVAPTCNHDFQTWTPAAAANELKPINCITWFEAMAFCIWDGGYLPTEAEWDFAASGGADQRAYPWSEPAAPLAVSPSDASYGDGTGTDCSGDGMSGCALSDLLAVGQRPAGNGVWGQSDLGGNVWEWNLDWRAAYTSSCADCANVTAGGERVIRGGSFKDAASNMRAQFRNSQPPDGPGYNVGVRCARAP